MIILDPGDHFHPAYPSSSDGKKKVAAEGERDKIRQWSRKASFDFEQTTGPSLSTTLLQPAQFASPNPLRDSKESLCTALILHLPHHTPNRISATLVRATMAGQLAPYKQEFLQAAISGGVLKFGSFELKSKRMSPYFFNAGEFHTARLAGAISAAFARTIIDAQRGPQALAFDVVFGPAYKGIPLAAAVAVKLGELEPRNLDAVSYSFDRKEAKDHGEGGSIVGAPLRGKRVLIVDDVITAGTAKRDAIEKIKKEGGVVAGIVVALDRMEKLTPADGDDTKPGPSAIGQLRKEFGFPVFAILTLDDIIEGMKAFASEDDVRRTEEYRQKYKATD